MKSLTSIVLSYVYVIFCISGVHCDNGNEGVLPKIGRGGPTVSHVETSTPISYFSEFFTDEMWDHLVKETNDYAAYIRASDPSTASPSSRKWDPVTRSDIKAFVGLCMAMGVLQLPDRADYFRKAKWLFETSFSRVFSRTRFFQIWRYFHLNPVEHEQVLLPNGMRDRLYKLRFMISHLNQQFGSKYLCHGTASIDESMVKYKGRLAFQQYMPAKPIKWGIKVWALAESTTGYMMRFQIYTGKEEGRQENGLAHRVVTDLLEGHENTNLKVYMDNFYSSVPLFRELSQKGIVGAGIGGTSTAYFLRQLFGDDLEIDIFEAGKVGGRAALINIDGKNYEAGAAVIHGKNKYMVQFADQFLKDVPKIARGGTGRVGLYDTDGMVLETSEWTAITLSKLMWRYGFDVYNIKHWLDGIFMKHFERIYQFQDNGMSFTNVEDLLKAMGDEVLNMTHHSMHDVLVEAGFSEAFVKEFGTAAMRTNYGQDTSAHGFVGAVTMYGIDSDLWSVPGGNRMIPVHLLEKSKANLIHAKVTTVALVKGEHDAVSYEVEYNKLGKDQVGQTGTREYDFLIIATPIHGSEHKISFVDFQNTVGRFSQDFQKIVTMFVQGNINKTTFNLDNENDFPEELLTVNSEVLFNSIGKQTSVDENGDQEEDSSKHSVWKTFLNQVPSETQVNQLFVDRKDFRLVEWLAYPKYKPNMDLPPFVLNEHLYYVNAIESAAAALEMNVIGAKNVALLTYSHFHGNLDKIDELHLPENGANPNERSDL